MGIVGNRALGRRSLLQNKRGQSVTLNQDAAVKSTCLGRKVRGMILDPGTAVVVNPSLNGPFIANILSGFL